MSQQFTVIANTKDIRINEMERFDINGRKILICNVEGQFYALDDTCSHEDASLYRGALKGKCVSCPMHGSRFDIETGEPLDEPATIPVATHPLKIEEETILIALKD